MSSSELLLWQVDEEEDFQKALTWQNKNQQPLSGFRTWRDVAMIMNGRASTDPDNKRRDYDAKTCETHYKLYTMYVMENLPLSKFALESAPWQTAEFDLLLQLLDHSVVGGTSTGFRLSWQQIAECMQRNDHQLLQIKSGIHGCSWTRKYTGNRVFLAWNAWAHLNQSTLTDEQKSRVMNFELGLLADVHKNPEKWAGS